MLKRDIMSRFLSDDKWNVACCELEVTRLGCFCFVFLLKVQFTSQTSMLALAEPKMEKTLLSGHYHHYME